MSELKQLMELQRQVTASRGKGERIMTAFWQVMVLAAFLGFLWYFLHRLNSHATERENLTFMLIAGFGVVVIAVLVGWDALFFNKVFDSEDALEARQSELAAEALGLPAGAVSLRFNQAKQHYTLIVTLERAPRVAERLTLETTKLGLTYHLHTDSLEDAIALIAANKGPLTAQ